MYWPKYFCSQAPKSLTPFKISKWIGGNLLSLFTNLSAACGPLTRRVKRCQKSLSRQPQPSQAFSSLKRKTWALINACLGSHSRATPWYLYWRVTHEWCAHEEQFLLFDLCKAFHYIEIKHESDFSAPKSPFYPSCVRNIFWVAF